jgi:sortase A
VSDNFSTQLPHPPELQPLTPARGTNLISFTLIAIGLMLLAVGGWMLAQYQLEALRPPPARIIEASQAVPIYVTVTPSPTPSPTQITPILSLSSAVSYQTLGDTITFRPTRALTPTVTAEPTQTPSTLAPATPSPTPGQADELSLESNPLEVAASDVAAEIPIESPITRIAAPTIGLDAPVIGVGWRQEKRNDLLVNVWTVADYAAGWHKNSALPGQGGNIVISGHHNIKGEVFRYTIDLNVGDTVTLYEGDQLYNYTVVDKFILKDKGEPDAIRRENAKWIGPFNEERLTLVTCWPYTNNTHRAIVIAKPVTQ